MRIKGCSNPSLRLIGKRRVIQLCGARTKTGVLILRHTCQSGRKMDINTILRYRPISATSIVSPLGFKASMWALPPSTFTTTKFSVLATFFVIPSGGMSTS